MVDHVPARRWQGAVRGRITQLSIWLSGRRSSWWSIVRLVPRAGRLLAVASIAVNLAIGLLPLGFVVATSMAVQRAADLIPGRPDSAAWKAAVAAVGLAVGALLVQSALTPFQTALAELVSRRVNGHLMRRLMRTTLESAPVAVLEQADVLERLGEAQRGLSEYVLTPGDAAAGLLALIARYTQPIGAVVIVGVVLGPLAAAVIAAVALVARVGQRIGLTLWAEAGWSARRGARRKVLYVADSGSAPEGGKEIRVLGILGWWRARAEAEARALFDGLWAQRRRIFMVPFICYSVIVVVGAVAVLVMLRDAADSGRLSVLEISLALQAILIPLRFGTFFPEADIQTQFGMHANDAIRLVESRAVEGEAAAPRGTRPAVGLPRSVIRFEKVSFAYPGSEANVLEEVELDLPRGTSTAIVGLNGAGKTTLVKLLARLYDVTGGRISVDGIDLRELDPRGWQRRLAVVYQDYVHYELDVATNVGLGAPERLDDIEGLRKALDWAGATEVVEGLPHGLETILSSRYTGGVDLSGGQWQRIALARALFAVGAGASVLVLDEPTAQLDVRAEVAFFDRFLELTGGLTTVVISHRFSTVRRADRIVVLEHGRICERGTHDELLVLGGRYAELFQLQARRFFEAGEEEPEDEESAEAAEELAE
jgi:ATP-binding cassette subfamily B protein